MVGRKFKIKLRPELFLEHSSELLRDYNGKVCRLVQHLRADLFVTDLDVPTGTPDSDYVRDGKLLVMIDKDGLLLPDLVSREELVFYEVGFIERLGRPRRTSLVSQCFRRVGFSRSPDGREHPWRTESEARTEARAEGRRVRFVRRTLCNMPPVESCTGRKG